MHGFLYKDFVLGKARLLIFGIIIAIECALAVALIASADPGEDKSFLICLESLIFFFMYFTVSSLNSEVFKTDETRSRSAFALSCPASAKGFIEAKYMYFLILNLAVSFILLLTGSAAMLIKNDISYSLTQVNFFLLCGQLFVTAIEIPFIIRFGSDKGSQIKAAVMGGIAVLAMLYALYADISFFLENDDLIEAILKQTNLAWGLTVFPYISGISYYISYRISVKLYRKGSAEYEQ